VQKSEKKSKIVGSLRDRFIIYWPRRHKDTKKTSLLTADFTDFTEKKNSNYYVRNCVGRREYAIYRF